MDKMEIICNCLECGERGKSRFLKIEKDKNHNISLEISDDKGNYNNSAMIIMDTEHLIEKLKKLKIKSK